MLVGFLIVLLIIVSCSFAYYFSNTKNKMEQLGQELQQKRLRDDATDKENRLITETNSQLRREREFLEKEQIRIETAIKNKNEQFQSLQEIQKQRLLDQQSAARKAFENYCDVLDADYEKKNAEYDAGVADREKDYQDYAAEVAERILEKRAEIDAAEAELQKVKATREATLQAILREKEIKEQLAFYCIQISDAEKADIQILEKIKPQLNKPRILSMLIWSTFYQKKMTELCNKVVGTTEKTGIYKITNQATGECYIGQAVKISDRWKQHAKNGLGIDTPAGNKLYKAMMEYGLWNFSWEVLEECPNSLLNEKEKYYIDLYDSYNFGYNSNRGIIK